MEDRTLMLSSLRRSLAWIRLSSCRFDVCYSTRFPILLSLQSHENMEIYQKAFDIIERYFGTEEEDKDVSAMATAILSKFCVLPFRLLLLPM